MKKLLFILLLFVINVELNAQNAYYDALFCGSLRPIDADASSYADITFTPGDSQILSEFKNFLEDPFVKDKPDMTRVKGIFKKIREAEKTSAFASGFGGMDLLTILPSIFNLSKLSNAQIDTLLYGVTIYFADEFRKGYMQTYMNGVKNTIGKEGDFQVLFPATYQKLLTFDPLRYKDFGNEMKGVFDEDLSLAFEHLSEQINTPKAVTATMLLNPTFCRNLKTKPIYPFLDMTATIGQKLISGVHPSDIFGHLDEKFYENTFISDQPTKDAIHLINILQRNLRDTTLHQSNQYSNVWINFEKLSKLNNPRTLAYFLALIYSEDKTFFDREVPSLGINLATLKGIALGGKPTQIDALIASTNLKASFKNLKDDKITALLSILVKIDEFIKLKDKNLLDEQNFEMYLKNVGELTKLVATLANKTPTANTAKIEEVINISSNVFKIYNAVRIKNYSNLPLYLSNIVRNFNLTVAEEGKLVEFIQKFDNFSSFASGIVSAKTSDDVNNVIKKFVDPPSSFIDKRNGNSHVTVGGMPGLFFASEKLEDDSENASLNIGLTLPIGIDFTLFKIKNKNNNYSTVSLFAQAFDLGAMLNYRLSTKSNVLPDKVGWDAIFSPGLALSVGLPQTPWTIQFGYQRGPKLRSINATGNDPLAPSDRRLPSDRWQIRFSYDIALKKIF